VRGDRDTEIEHEHLEWEEELMYIDIYI